MKVLVRRAKLSDAEQLRTLLKELMRDGKSFYSDSFDYSLDEYKSTLNAQTLESFIFTFVAEVDGEIVGWAMVARRNFKFKMHVVNLLIGVKKEFRSLGVGAKMIKAIELAISKFGIEKIDVHLHGKDREAINFFKSQGYVVDGLKKRALKMKNSYDNEVLMSKTID